MGRFAWLHRSPRLNKACNAVHSYIEPIVASAIERNRVRSSETKGVGSGEIGGDRYTFLDELAKEGVKPKEMRDQVLNVLVAARDTTACLMSSVIFEISHRQDVQVKVRKEVDALEGRPPTYEEIKEMKYLNNVIKETLRLHPPVPINVRVANKDTYLPLGGGPEGTSPVFIEKGQHVAYQVYSMHRRPDIWGPDANDFMPERWLTARPGYEFLPFNGGPRICPGEFLTEADTSQS